MLSDASRRPGLGRLRRRAIGVTRPVRSRALAGRQRLDGARRPCGPRGGWRL